jgi:kumamolisin
MGTPAFRDIKTGNNGAFQAGPGYDLVTGIGVPNVKELIRALTQ